MPYNADFWGPNPNSYAPVSGKMPARDRVQRLVNREGFRQYTALFNALIGAATGSNVTATHRRIAHVNDGGGGVRTLETVTDINRNTTAADVTSLKEVVTGVTARPIPYPKDLSGNGGPALS